jgi:nicotinate-nucleotide adenylyltransferase
VRTGILGGTFDPIHLGHIAAARAAVDCARLDRVLFIPTGSPPHRRGTVATPEQRLDMTRLAIREGDPFEVSDVEVRRGGVSYTADTLKQLKAMYPDDELYLILGWDAARLFRTWHVPDEVRRLALVIIVSRPGAGAPDNAAIQAAGLDPSTSIVCVRSTPDVSASALRRAIARGEPVSDRVPEAVAGYIAKHRLYGDNRQVGR